MRDEEKSKQRPAEESGEKRRQLHISGSVPGRPDSIPDEERRRAMCEFTSDYVVKLCVGAGGELSVKWVTGKLAWKLEEGMGELHTPGGWRGRVHPEDLSLAEETHAKVLSGEEVRLELRVLLPDGDLRFLDVTAKPQWDDESGRVSAVLAGATDVTERKTEERARRESQQMFRTLGEMSPGMIFICDSEGLVYVNRKCEEVLGYSREEMYEEGFDFLQRHLPACRERIMESFNSHTRGEEVEPYEAPLLTRDGELLEAIIATRLIPYRDGRAVLGTITDITRRKRAEERISSLLSFKEKVLETAPIWIDTLDTEGNITSWNAAAEDISGYSKREVLGHDGIWELLYPDPQYCSYIRGVARDLIQTGRELKGFETTICTKGGDSRVISWYTIGLTDEKGGSAGSVAFGIDVTDQKRMQQRLFDYHRKVRSLATKLSLAEEQERQRIGGLLHDEVTQNLTACRLMLGSMELDGVPAEARGSVGAALDLLEGAIERTDSLAFDLASPLLHQVGLASSLERQAEKILGANGIDWEMKQDENEESLPEEARVMLFRATRELLFNVLKHAGASHVKIDVSRREDSLRVCVEDDGCGFEPSEADSESSRRTGLGLLSIRERLAYLGGRLEIESEPGKGTVATLVTPLESGEGEPD